MIFLKKQLEIHSRHEACNKEINKLKKVIYQLTTQKNELEV